MKKVMLFITIALLLTGCANKRLDDFERRITQNERLAQQTAIVAVKNSERIDQIYKPGKNGQGSGMLVQVVDSVISVNERINTLGTPQGTPAFDARFEKLLQATRENRDMIEHGSHVAFSIFFNIGATELDETAINMIKTIAEESAELEAATVIGYADQTGNSEVNKKISLKRAEAVKEAMKNAGIDVTHVEAVGFGSTERFGFANKHNNRRAVIYAPNP